MNKTLRKIQIINGPNLNLLGQRETDVYGRISFDDFLLTLKQDFPKIDILYFQSNIEGEIIDCLQKSDKSVDGIILNAGGYTHTSVSIRDAVSAIQTKVVEVHISNLASRESFRHTSLITPVCKGSIIGFGLEAYALALQYFIRMKR